MCTMKTNIAFLAAALILTPGISSCVNEVYDFNKLNLEITVAPGISIPVDKSLGEVGSDKMLGISDCATDDNGTYMLCGEKSTDEISVSEEDLQNGSVLSGKVIEVPVTVPDFLRHSKTEFRLHNPEIEFQINNPHTCAVILKGEAMANGSHADFEAEIPAGCDTYTVRMGGKGLSDIMFPVPDNIIIGNLSFKAKSMTKAGDTQAEGSVVYKLSANANIRMEFEPGSEITFDTTLDLEEMGADLSKISVSVKEFKVMTSVSSTFPLDLIASASSDGGTTTLSMENAVLACTTTEVTLKAKTDGALSDIKNIHLTVSARNTSDGPVALSPDNTLAIDINRLTAVSGIKYNPQ